VIQPTISLPPLDEVARHWHEAEPIIRRATDRSGSYEPIDLLTLAFHGRMAIWFVRLDGELIAVAVTEIRQFPRNRVLQIPFIAGRFMSAWHRPLLAALEVHAKDAGCSCLQGFDRRGWGRVANFAETGVILERKVNV
jgi:hypothetical protein